MIKWLLIIAGAALLFLWFTRGSGAGNVFPQQVYPGSTYVQGYHG